MWRPDDLDRPPPPWKIQRAIDLFLREPKATVPDDVLLLREVAEAFKHFKLNRSNATVAGADAMATIERAGA
jgi:hypothetical protein